MLATGISRAERNDWARETFRGASYTIIVPFKPDLSDIDEEALRANVRHCIEQGYFSVSAAVIGGTDDERLRALRIALDEAGDRIQVSGSVGGATLAEAIERAQLVESLGCTHFLLSLPPRLHDADELYNYGKQLIESTNMGVVFYGTNNSDFRHLDPSNIPFDVLERLAEQPNVVGMKCTHTMDPVTALTCCERLGDKVLLGPVNLEHAPFMARFSQIQWTGMWAVDAIQSPEKRYVVNYMNLLANGNLEEAKRYYYEFRDLVQLFWNVQGTWLYKGVHPWAHLNYYSYCVGGNGGPLRPPAATHGHDYFPPLDAADRKLIRDTYEACGIAMGGINDDEAMVGRSAFARGTRPHDLRDNPTWR